MEARERRQELLNAQIQEEDQPQQQERDTPEVPDDGSGGMTNLSTESVRRDGDTTMEGSTTTYFDSTARETEWNPASTNSNRGKRVRIVTPSRPTYTAKESPLVNQSKSAFPAFYRVVQDSGASVYNDGEEVSFVIRMIPFGVVLLGCDLGWRNCDGENRLMVRIPDGWVIDDDIERIVDVQF